MVSNEIYNKLVKLCVREGKCIYLSPLFLLWEKKACACLLWRLGSLCLITFIYTLMISLYITFSCRYSFISLIVVWKHGEEESIRLHEVWEGGGNLLLSIGKRKCHVCSALCQLIHHRKCIYSLYVLLSHLSIEMRGRSEACILREETLYIKCMKRNEEACMHQKPVSSLLSYIYMPLWRKRVEEEGWERMLQQALIWRRKIYRLYVISLWKAWGIREA